MNLWKKAAVSFAATSMVLAPVAASAAPAWNAAQAVSITEDQNELEGASWVAIVLGLAIIGGGIWLVVDDDGDDDPVSPG
ncbi:MAG: hypothetical protein JHC57_17395 [Sphingopyxis sp.]|uniref:hypothetical protein n=1 Tax=Sphingopyxis sp. TaxID=1908224 RepID=UPI001A29B063|nr:hypothetical protein [Sphingopyxis sp.]MBJ7501536.1 hypothetical protein [Sphingopyxis sp.]